MAFRDRFDYGIAKSEILLDDGFSNLYDQYDEAKTLVESTKGSIDEFIQDSGTLTADDRSLVAGGTALISGAARGAVAGATIGSFFGPIGAVVGGVIGGVAYGAFELANYLSTDAKKDELARSNARLISEQFKVRSRQDRKTLDRVRKETIRQSEATLKNRKLQGRRIQLQAERSYNALVRVRDNAKNKNARGILTSENKIRDNELGIQFANKALDQIGASTLAGESTIDARLTIIRDGIYKSKKYLTDSYYSAELNKEQQESVIASQKASLRVAGEKEASSLGTAEDTVDSSTRRSLRSLSATLQAVTQLEQAQTGSELAIRRANLQLDNSLLQSGLRSKQADLAAKNSLLNLIQKSSESVLRQEEKKAKYENNIFGLSGIIANLNQQNSSLDSRFNQDLNLLKKTTLTNIAQADADFANRIDGINAKTGEIIDGLIAGSNKNAIAIRNNIDRIRLGEDIRDLNTSRANASTAVSALSKVGKQFGSSSKPRPINTDNEVAALQEAD